MRRFVVVRVGLALVSVIGVSVLSFVLLRLAPGDPVRLVLGPFATREQVARFRAEQGLDQSLVVQYWRFLSGFATGDWGFSNDSGVAVRELFAQRLAPTIELAVVAFAVALALAIVTALLVTYRRRPVLDRAVRVLTFFALGLPEFWFGLLLLLLLSQQLELFPGPGGQISATIAPVPHRTGLLLADSLLAGRPDAFGNAAWHLALPALTLGLGVWGYLLSMLRASLLEVSGEPYIRVAEAKGVSRWRAFVRHALPNAALPTLTASGLILAQLMTGSVLVEAVFDWPGIGGLVVRAIANQDYAVVQAFVVIIAVAYVFLNLAVDLLYGVIDPRIRMLPATSAGLA